MRSLVKGILAFSGLLFLSSAIADFPTDLNNSYNAMANKWGNITKPGVYQGQSAGYYTGGSLYLRTQNRKTRLLNLSLPSVKAGCGGIDAHMGSFSMINSDQLVAAAKNIGANAVSYAFYLAISKLCSECKNIMSDLQRWANNLNQANIDSCNTAKWAVSGMFQKKKEAERYRCAAFGSWEGVFKDFGAGLNACGNNQSTELVTDKTNSNPKDAGSKGALRPSINIGWQVVQTLVDAQADKQLAEFMMTLTGTIVFRPPCVGYDDRPTNQVACGDVVYASEAKKIDSPKKAYPVDGSVTESLINVLLYGSPATATKVTIRTCIPNALLDPISPCLFMGTREVDLNSNSGIHQKVKSELQAILSNLKNEVRMTPGQKSLLATVRIPVMKMMTVYLAYSPLQAETAVNQYSEIIALDYVESYVSAILREIKKASLAYPHSKNAIEEYRKKIFAMQKNLNRIIKKRKVDLLQNIQLVKEVQVIERMLISSMSPGLAQSVRFIKTLR